MISNFYIFHEIFKFGVQIFWNYYASKYKVLFLIRKISKRGRGEVVFVGYFAEQMTLGYAYNEQIETV